MKLLDGCCKEGGAGKGYAMAGFTVTGVDIEPQPRYPFAFVRADVRDYLKQHGALYDAIHVSPPCQSYTEATRQWRAEGREYPDIIAEIRDILIWLGKPYVIENVKNAPLINPVMLNGAHFGMMVARDRYYECSFPMPFMLLKQHSQKPVKMGRPVKEGDVVFPVGHFSGTDYARRQMGVEWMTQDGTAEAVPPAHTEYIGRYMMAECQRAA